MKTMHKFILTTILLLLLVACFAVPGALAAPASSVCINSVTLNAVTPYWKNDNTTYATEPASGWNAYFNAPTGTLTLKNAVINTPSAFLTAYSLVCANGDLSLVLSWYQHDFGGNSNTQEDICGITIQGMLSISGDGSADIQIVNTHASGTAVAVFKLLQSDARLRQDREYGAGGFHCARIVFYAECFDCGRAGGGQHQGAQYHGCLLERLRVPHDGRQHYGKSRGNGRNRHVRHMGFCSAPSLILRAVPAASRPMDPDGIYPGLCYSTDTLSYSGGTFTFTGPTSALLNNGSSTAINYSLNDDALVYASKSTSGTAPILWESDADGILTSLLLVPSMSEFLYVRFTQPVTPPQTGDVQTPLLWTGIALFVLLGAAGLKRRTWRECR